MALMTYEPHVLFLIAQMRLDPIEFRLGIQRHAAVETSPILTFGHQRLEFPAMERRDRLR